MLFHVCLSGGPVASLSGSPDVGVALSSKAGTAPINWVPINSRLCAVKLESSTEVKTNRCDKRCPFVIPAYSNRLQSVCDQ